MNNKLVEGLLETTNFEETENGALAHKSTLSALYDMFAFGGAYRSREDNDCILLFKKSIRIYFIQMLYFFESKICFKVLINILSDISFDKTL